MRTSAAATLAAALIMTIPALCQSRKKATARTLKSNCDSIARLKVGRKKVRGNWQDIFSAGRCYGYVDGLIDGMDDVGLSGEGGRPEVLNIDRAEISSTQDVVQAFRAYVAANPLSRGKPAWRVLLQVLEKGGLASLSPARVPVPASQLTARCAKIATNIQSEFRNDPALTPIDTPTLGSADSALAACLNTDGLTTTDKNEILGSLVEVEAALLGRADHVLSSNGLSLAFRTYRPSAAASTQRPF